MSADICGKIFEVLLIATVVVANPEPGNAHQDKLDGEFFDRAHEEWPRQNTHLDNTTQSLDKTVLAKQSYMQEATSVGDAPDPAPAPAPICNSTKKMQISADWSLLSCSTAVKGDLTHEVTIGISNESEYSQSFEKMVKDQFQAGMEFAIGPLVKNKLTGEGKRIFESAFSTSSEKETTDGVSCEVFGGTWCMWQWHMTFSQCGSIVDWYSPITQCKRGMSPPGPPSGVEKFEPGMSLWFAGDGLSSSWLVVAIALSMVATLRRFYIKDTSEPLYVSS